MAYLAALIAQYKQPPVTPATAPMLPPQPAPALAVTPVTRVTPQNTEGQNQKQNPDAMLADIAAMLQADPDQLRALLSADDMHDIAQGFNSRGYMLDYFRLMRSDGKPLADDEPAPSKLPENRSGHIEQMQAWKSAHDAMINHLMDCRRCYAPRSEYCSDGERLRADYLAAQERFRDIPEASLQLALQHLVT